MPIELMTMRKLKPHICSNAHTHSKQLHISRTESVQFSIWYHAVHTLFRLTILSTDSFFLKRFVIYCENIVSV